MRISGVTRNGIFDPIVMDVERELFEDAAGKEVEVYGSGGKDNAAHLVKP